MKKKPSVVSKKAKAKAKANVREEPRQWTGSIEFQAQSTAFGAPSKVPVAVTSAAGFTNFDPATSISAVETSYRPLFKGHSYKQAGQGRPGAVRFEVTDGDAGGFLAIQGQFAASKIGKKGKLLKARGFGYATSGTGVFDDNLAVNTKVGLRLNKDGRHWTIRSLC